MRITKMTLAATLLSCVATLALLHYLDARQAGKLGWFKAQNDALRYQAYQKSRQAGGPGPAVKGGREERDAEGGALAPEGRNTSLDKTQPGTGEIYGYHDAGQLRPEDTLQTFVWACERGDATRVASLITFPPGDRARAEDYFASLPPEQRGQWQGVQQLAAHLLILSSLASSFPAADVLAAAPVQLHGEDRATCGVAQRIQVRKVDGLWYYDFNAARLESLHQEVTRALAASPKTQ